MSEPSKGDCGVPGARAQELTRPAVRFPVKQNFEYRWLYRGGAFGDWRSPIRVNVMTAPNDAIGIEWRAVRAS